MIRKHVLVVGTGPYFGLIVETLVQHDCDWSLIGEVESLSRLTVEHHPTMVVGMARGTHGDVWLETAASISANSTIDHIVCLVDPFMEFAAHIAEAQGISWHSPETISVLHSKRNLRVLLSQLSLASVPQVSVESAEDIVEFGMAVGWPIIVKPEIGTASIGVTRLDGPDGAQQAYDRIREFPDFAKGSILAESFIIGPQFSAETISIDGVLHVLAITRKFSEPVGMVEIGHQLPAEISAAELSLIDGYLNKLFEGAGVQFGPSCSEFVLTADGPVAFEVQLRVGGDKTNDMLITSTGVNLVRLAVMQQIGLDVSAEVVEAQSIGERPYSAIWFAYAGCEGIIVDVLGTLEAELIDGVVSVDVPVRTGERVFSLRNCLDRHASVRAAGVSGDEAVSSARTAAEGLEFVLRTAGRAPIV